MLPFAMAEHSNAMPVFGQVRQIEKHAKRPNLNFVQQWNINFAAAVKL